MHNVGKKFSESHAQRGNVVWVYDGEFQISSVISPECFRGTCSSPAKENQSVAYEDEFEDGEIRSTELN
ncbi:hypothetical protein E3N88_09354 [Mikania micrantha]|uniref:Uncharacterized protein n=1 Tax=Mikania micrantha TaxID=192012 RepID=A0A5N6PJQ2_9ASTR|nr:hypothetical protein E3N88_09354 [Mikania micrantha]